MDLERLKFPIGKFVLPEAYTKGQINTWVRAITDLPMELNTAINQLSETDIDKAYRPEGWTGRQVVHHLADSHLNCLVRIKLALTEDNPIIKPYHEEKWALLSDYSLDIKSSVQIVEGVHAHLASLFAGMQEADFFREFTHPEYKYTRPIAYLCALYAWHGSHHCGHLRLLRAS
jgi:hypothetical protein